MPSADNQCKNYPHKASCLIGIITDYHSDGIPQRISENKLKRKQQTTNSMQISPGYLQNNVPVSLPHGTITVFIDF